MLSFPLLVWNELKAARIYRILTAARKGTHSYHNQLCVVHIVSVGDAYDIAVRKNVDCDRVDASLNGQLVHSVGRIETPEILRVTIQPFAIH